ncbi:hypothetical protein WJ969_13195 [Achromobacter xylosoxidans]
MSEAALDTAGPERSARRAEPALRWQHLLVTPLALAGWVTPLAGGDHHAGVVVGGGIPNAQWRWAAAIGH